MPPMTLRTCLIMMTALAVITDNLIIPFYPQYFAEDRKSVV